MCKWVEPALVNPQNISQLVQDLCILHCLLNGGVNPVHQYTAARIHESKTVTEFLNKLELVAFCLCEKGFDEGIGPRLRINENKSAKALKVLHTQGAEVQPCTKIDKGRSKQISHGSSHMMTKISIQLWLTDCICLRLAAAQPFDRWHL